MSLHPQVVQLLERAAKSPLPQLYEVPAHVARRIYRDTRAALAPKAPEVASASLVLAPGPVALRSYRPLGTKPDEPAQVSPSSSDVVIEVPSLSSTTASEARANTAKRLSPSPRGRTTAPPC